MERIKAAGLPLIHQLSSQIKCLQVGLFLIMAEAATSFHFGFKKAILMRRADTQCHEGGYAVQLSSCCLSETKGTHSTRVTFYGFGCCQITTEGL